MAVLLALRVWSHTAIEDQSRALRFFSRAITCCVCAACAAFAWYRVFVEPPPRTGGVLTAARLCVGWAVTVFYLHFQASRGPGTEGREGRADGKAGWPEGERVRGRDCGAAGAEGLLDRTVIVS